MLKFSHNSHRLYETLTKGQKVNSIDFAANAMFVGAIVTATIAAVSIIKDMVKRHNNQH